MFVIWLIFFIIFFSPVPQGQKVLCKIIRSKDGFGKFYPQYELYIEDTENGEETRTFLLAARKRKKSKSSHYIITTDKLNVAVSSKNIVGKVR